MTHDSLDRPAITDGVITLQMIEAGRRVLVDHDGASPTFLAEKVYRAMDRCRTGSQPFVSDRPVDF